MAGLSGPSRRLGTQLNGKVPSLALVNVEMDGRGLLILLLAVKVPGVGALPVVVVAAWIVESD